METHHILCRCSSEAHHVNSTHGIDIMIVLVTFNVEDISSIYCHTVNSAVPAHVLIESHPNFQSQIASPSQTLNLGFVLNLLGILGGSSKKRSKKRKDHCDH